MDATCPPAACPHLEGNDRRCACRWTISHLHEAFALCLGSYHHCPIYYRIASERAEGRPMLRLVTLTAGEGARAAIGRSGDVDDSGAAVVRRLCRSAGDDAPCSGGAVGAGAGGGDTLSRSGAGFFRRGLRRLGLTGS